jgi:hypothetical protein
MQMSNPEQKQKKNANKIIEIQKQLALAKL